LRGRDEHLEGTTLGDGDLGLRGARSGTVGLDLFHEVSTINNFAEDDVRVIEPRGDDGGDEELGAVGVLSGVGHGEDVGLGVLELEVLICEFLAVDGLSTSSVAPGEVTTLEHELGDDTVERGTLISEAVLASGKLTEVLGSLGDDVVVQLEGDATGVNTANGDIEVDVGH